MRIVLLYICIYSVNVQIINAQSLKKQEAKATNRTKITLAEGDTIRLVEVSLKKRIHLHKKRFYYWYAANKVHHAQGESNGHLLHGPYRVVNRNQDPILKGTFHYGNKSGKWLAWHPNGQLASVSHWHSGHLHGHSVMYDPEGKRLAKPSKADAKNIKAKDHKEKTPGKKKLFQFFKGKRNKKVEASQISTQLSNSSAPETGEAPSLKKSKSKRIKQPVQITP